MDNLIMICYGKIRYNYLNYDKNKIWNKQLGRVWRYQSGNQEKDRQHKGQKNSICLITLNNGNHTAMVTGKWSQDDANKQ